MGISREISYKLEHLILEGGLAPGQKIPSERQLVARLGVSRSVVREALHELQARGVQLVGAGTPQVFIHPKSAHGVMIQLWPKDRPHRWRDGGS